MSTDLSAAGKKSFEPSAGDRLAGSAPLIALTVLLVGAAIAAEALRVTLGVGHHFPLWPLFAGMGLISAGGAFILPPRDFPTPRPATPLAAPDVPTTTPHSEAKGPSDSLTAPAPLAQAFPIPSAEAGPDKAGLVIPNALDAGFLPGAAEGHGGVFSVTLPHRESLGSDPQHESAESTVTFVPETVPPDSQPEESVAARLAEEPLESVAGIPTAASDYASPPSTVETTAGAPHEELRTVPPIALEAPNPSFTSEPPNNTAPEPPAETEADPESGQPSIQSTSSVPSEPSSAAMAENSPEPATLRAVTATEFPPTESPLKAAAARLSALAGRWGQEDETRKGPWENHPSGPEVSPSEILPPAEPLGPSPNEVDVSGADLSSPTPGNTESLPIELGPSSLESEPSMTQPPASFVLPASSPEPTAPMIGSPKDEIATPVEAQASTMECVRCGRHVGPSVGLSSCTDCGRPFCTDCFQDVVGSGGPLLCSQCFMWNPLPRARNPGT
jgi:hypothetical protein